MPKFLIKLPSQKKYIFEFDSDIRIGRGEECELVLPDSSVSRHHASVSIVGDETMLEDPASQNGIVIGGTKLNPETQYPLDSKMEIQIGNFTLIYLTDSQQDQFYRNRSISYLQKYDPNEVQSNEEDTLQLSRKQATTMLRDQNTLNHGCIVTTDGRQYFPENKTLTFGSKSAQVKVEGWFVRGIVAEITWDGHSHVLTKKSGFTTKVQVNGKNIASKALVVNDSIQIGGTSFQYVLDKT